jgi:hypothetical protein
LVAQPLAFRKPPFFDAAGGEDTLALKGEPIVAGDEFVVAGLLLCAYPEPKAARVSRTSAASFVTSFYFISLSLILNPRFHFDFFSCPLWCGGAGEECVLLACNLSPVD